jgi:hypothetical protein
MRKDFKEYYRLLNLSPGATPVEIRRSYHQILRRWHPDLFKPGSLMQKTAEDITKDANEAFEQLIKKKHYRKFPPPGEAVAPKPPPRPVRRTPRKEPPAAKPPRRPAATRFWRFPSRPWWKLAAVACILGAAFAGFSLRADIRSIFAARGPRPVAAAPTAAGAPERPAGLAAVSVPTGAARPAAAREARLPEAPIERPTRVEIAAIAIPEVPKAGIVFQQPAGTPDSFAVPRVDLPSWAPETPSHSALLVRALEETTTRLRTFGIGASKATVLEIQGPPDEDRGSVVRYGSSLVYFSDGWVKGWSDGYPRLAIHRWPRLAAYPMARFSLGSGRAEVIQAEGMPTRFTANSYLYGTSFVFFDNDGVSAFGEGDLRLNSLTIPVLPDLGPTGLP